MRISAGPRLRATRRTARTVPLAARDRWLAALTLAGFLLVALAARARSAPPAATPIHRSGGPPQVLVTPRPVTDRPRTRNSSAVHHLRLPWALVETIMLATMVLALIGLVVAFWPRLPAWRRSRRLRRAVRPADYAAEDLIRQVSDTLRSTMSQLTVGQIRDGVILCWHRLEQTAEAAGMRRSAADTSSDLANRLLASMPVSEAPLNRLAALYREARFSSHPIPAEAVTWARADLAQLRSELEAASAGGAAGAGHG